jgi:signal transduction histidine kinase
MVKLKKQPPYWTVLAVSILIATITQASILSINGWAERSYKSQKLLAEFDKNLNNINALEWEAISKKQIDPGLNEQINKAQILADVLLKKLDLDTNNQQIKKLIFAYQKYNNFFHEELKLISENQVKQAIQIDDEQVDPAFSILNNQINVLSIYYDKQKQKAIQISNLSIAIVLLLCSGTLGGFFWTYNIFLFKKNQELQKILNELKQTQSQLIQTEKMAGLGQMVAGIAHEINNPVTFIHSNIQHIKNYAQDLIKIVVLYQKHYPESTLEIQNCIEEIDLEFLSEDLNKILLSMTSGTERIRNIVLSLRNFARLGEADIKDVDLHEGIESTLLILSYKFLNQIEIIRQYSDLPKVSCFPGLMNQVFMNILTNAGDALLSQKSLLNKQIIIHTEKLGENKIRIKIRDNGVGIPLEFQAQIFDPFFTTKPIGKGTGLGLSICYKIIEKHSGTITVTSEVGKGTEFAITLPIRYNLPD